MTDNCWLSRHGRVVVGAIVALVVVLSVLVMGCPPGAGGRYELTISSTAGGSVITPGEGSFFHDPGTVIELVAMADEDCQFHNWTGDTERMVDRESPNTTLTVDGDYSITANFLVPAQPPSP